MTFRVHTSMKTLNVIGCGKVGRTLGRVWTRHGVFEVQSILNRSLKSGSAAVGFVGAGAAVAGYDRMRPAEVVMISTPDEAIEACCRELCEAGLVDDGAIVFHCSGALPAEVLGPARERGAAIASIHPVKSFADPAMAAESFAGTFCAVEGDAAACEVLANALHRCGARSFAVDPQQKTIYHAATVIVCNYFVALMEAGLRCFEKAGIPRETAIEVMQPIVAGTVENFFELGPIRALTGPIARGERTVVERQCEALGQWDEQIQRIYKDLGLLAAELSAAAGNADADALAAIEEILGRRK